MSLRIAGMGWVTPLGSGVDPVWKRLLQGDEPIPERIADDLGAQPYFAYRVPDSALGSLAAHPRLRRASAISRFAAAAGLEALESAGLRSNLEAAKRIALVFAISNGGVIYTKRFYRDIVKAGAQAASPLLFPETVFNAPASHLAAILGITGATYTLVGDGAVGILAMRMAEDLMSNDTLDHCLVVGAEEADWLLCDAYRKWRLLRLRPPVEPFARATRGTTLGEGAGAVLLARDGPIKVERTEAGGYYRKRAEAAQTLKTVLSNLAETKIDICISSANGTFIDQAECEAISKINPELLVYSPKPALGEGVGAVGLWQMIVGAKALLESALPPLLHLTRTVPLRTSTTRIDRMAAQRAVILSCGMNQQVAGLRLALS